MEQAKYIVYDFLSELKKQLENSAPSPENKNIIIVIDGIIKELQN